MTLITTKPEMTEVLYYYTEKSIDVQKRYFCEVTSWNVDVQSLTQVFDTFDNVACPVFVVVVTRGRAMTYF